MQYNMCDCVAWRDLAWQWSSYDTYRLVNVKQASGLYTLSKNEKLTGPWNGRATPQKNYNKKKKKHTHTNRQ